MIDIQIAESIIDVSNPSQPCVGYHEDHFVHKITVKIPESLVGADYYIIKYANISGTYQSEKLISQDKQSVSASLPDSVLQAPAYYEGEIFCQLVGYINNDIGKQTIKHSPVFKLRVLPSV